MTNQFFISDLYKLNDIRLLIIYNLYSFLYIYIYLFNININ